RATRHRAAPGNFSLEGIGWFVCAVCRGYWRGGDTAVKAGKLQPSLTPYLVYAFLRPNWSHPIKIISGWRRHAGQGETHACSTLHPAFGTRDGVCTGTARMFRRGWWFVQFLFRTDRRYAHLVQ